MRRLLVPVAAVIALAALASGAAARARPQHEFTVLYRAGSDPAQARRAVALAGGRVVAENAAVGVATARSPSATFAVRAARAQTIAGVAPAAPIGRAPGGAAPRWRAVEQRRGVPVGSLPRERSARTSAEPLASLQWDMSMIGATDAGSYAQQRGSHAVRVGVIDTGVDASHPDIAANFDHSLSRNFTVDIPAIDGPCGLEPDRSCHDADDADENGHGTHVAGTIGAALDGLGIAGVAPDADLVSLRAGQDSGFFFLQPTVDALTYAGDHGIDVVNMSFYVDPWLYNCAAGAADSPAEQQEQRTIIEAMDRALRYARDHGVTLIAALGNEAQDLGHPVADDSSPDFPPGAVRHRPLDDTCVQLPAEGEGVIGVSSVGPSGRKAAYSNWGLTEADVSAPGGDLDDPGSTGQRGAAASEILAPYPRAVGRANGDIDAQGAPTTSAILRDCAGGRCGYYQWLQGTSMAAPHAAGVAALIVAAHGSPDPVQGGLTLDPSTTEAILRATATDTACPLEVGACTGTALRNAFFGDGVVDARAAVAD